MNKLNIIDNITLKVDTLLHEMNFKFFGNEQLKLNMLIKESQEYLSKSKRYLWFYFLLLINKN